MKKFFILLLFGMLAACVSTPENTGNQSGSIADQADKVTANIIWQLTSADEAKLPTALKARVSLYLRQYYQRQWGKNYLLQTPKNRKEFSERAYRVYYTGGWQVYKMQVKSVTKKSQKYIQVNTLIYMRHPVSGKENRVMMKDRWKNIDGQWYHEFYDPFIKLQSFG